MSRNLTGKDQIENRKSDDIYEPTNRHREPRDRQTSQSHSLTDIQRGRQTDG